MRFLKNLMGERRHEPAAPQATATACPHVALVPRWDSADDIGKAVRVSRYVCESCGADFSREDGERVQAEEVQRVRSAEVDRLKAEQEGR